MNRTRAAALAVVAIAAAAGCSTTTRGAGVGPAYTSVAGLAAKITQSASQLKSAQGTLHVESGPLTQTSTFREQFGGGLVTAFDDQVDTTLQGTNTKLHLVYADKKLYVDRGQNGKPWVVASPDSSDRVVAQLAQTLPQTLAQSGITYYALMLSAAHDLKVVGAENVDGVPTIRYHFVVDPRALLPKLPPDQAQQMQQAVDAGVDSVPADEWIDAQGRPVKVTDSVTAQGQTAHVEFRINHYDDPITIQAPPADQIDPG